MTSNSPKSTTHICKQRIELFKKDITEWEKETKEVPYQIGIK
jgi:hypothetical protein